MAAIDYRIPPEHLPTSSLIAELLWIGDAVTWPGQIGQWARDRVAAIRTEVRQREWGARCQ